MKTISIIGAGISGLTAGIYAQQRGFESVIYERHSVAGGLCSYWNRKGYQLDNCLHWLTGTRKDTELYQLWQNTGVIADDIEVIAPEAFMQVEGNGERLVLWHDVDRLRSDMLALSPADRSEIENFIKLIKIFSKTIFPCQKPPEDMNLWDYLRLVWKMRKIGRPFRKYGKMSLREYANRFKHPLIRKFLTTYFPHFYSVACQLWVFGMFTSGNADLPRGGSKGVIDRMVERYLQLGGKICYNMEAKRIGVKNGLVDEIEFANGKVIRSDYVVTACDLHHVVSNLLPEFSWDNYLTEHYKTETEKYPTHTSFNVFLSVDFYTQALQYTSILEPELLYINGKEIKELVIKDFNYEPSFSPEGATLLQVIVNQYEDDADFWHNLRRYEIEKYRTEKQRVSEEIMESIENRFPEMRGHIKVLDATTPATNIRYTNTYKGAYMGFAMTYFNKKQTHKGTISEIKNLYLAGQALAAPGGTPNAVASGKFAIDRIVRDIKKGK